MTSIDHDQIELLCTQLTQGAAIPASEFPADDPNARYPGLYAWWPDDVGARLLSAQLGEDLRLPIYVGQAGATSRRSGKASGATLESRILRNHIQGTLRSSTFRRTMASILREPLALALDAPKRLSSASNTDLSTWIRNHLFVSIVAVGDPAALAMIEDAVLTNLDPPLNLMGMRSSPVRSRLLELRKNLEFV